MVTYTSDTKQQFRIAFIDVIRSSFLFRGIADEQLAHILNIADVEDYPDGVELVTEGAKDSSLYLILEGKVDVIKHHEKSGDSFTVATLQAGNQFGEMSLVGESARSATVRTNGSVRILKLSRFGLEALRHNEAQTAYASLLYNISNQLAKKLANTNETTVAALQDDLEQANYRLASTEFIISITFIMVSYAVALAVLGFATNNWILAHMLSGALTLLYAAICVALIHRSPYTLPNFGFRAPQNWKKDISVALLWALGMITVGTAVKYALILMVPVFENIPLFYLPGVALSQASMWYLGAYLLSIPLQEIITRSALQSSLTIFFEGVRWKHAHAIIISNVIFAASHLHLSVFFALLTFVTGCIWGVLYAHQKSLVGVSISHVLAGAFGVQVLGIAWMLSLL